MDGRMDRQTDEQWDGWMDRVIPIYPASRVEKPGAYSTPDTPSGRGVNKYIKIQ
jgi:hypothetical protein